MKINELASAAGVPVRTVRYYLSRGVLPAPEFRGPHTVYGPEYLARLRAIQRLQEDYLPLDEIAGAVEGRSVEELELLAREGVGRQVLEEPLPAAPVHPDVESGEGAPDAKRRHPLEEPRRPSVERLVRHRLLPGVELVVDEDAPPPARRLVERILSDLGGGSESGEEPKAEPAGGPGSAAGKRSRKRTSRKTR